MVEERSIRIIVVGYNEACTSLEPIPICSSLFGLLLLQHTFNFLLNFYLHHPMYFVKSICHRLVGPSFCT